MRLLQPLTAVMHPSTFALTFSSPVPEKVWIKFAYAQFKMGLVQQVVEAEAFANDARGLRRFDGEGRNLVHREFGRGVV